MYSNHKAPRTVSRRAVLGTAAGAGVVGAGAAVGIVKLTGGDDETTSTASQATTAVADTDTYVEASMADESPAVFFVQANDPNVRVYFGAKEILVKDQKLASSLWQKAQQS
jgi:nitrous oxide reductase